MVHDGHVRQSCRRQDRRTHSWETVKSIAGQFPTLTVCHETKRVWWHGGQYFSGDNVLHLQRFVVGRRFVQHRLLQEAFHLIGDIDDFLSGVIYEALRNVVSPPLMAPVELGIRVLSGLNDTFDLACRNLGEYFRPLATVAKPCTIEHLRQIATAANKVKHPARGISLGGACGGAGEQETDLGGNAMNVDGIEGAAEEPESTAVDASSLGDGGFGGGSYGGGGGFVGSLGGGKVTDELPARRELAAINALAVVVAQSSSPLTKMQKVAFDKDAEGTPAADVADIGACRMCARTAGGCIQCNALARMHDTVVVEDVSAKMDRDTVDDKPLSAMTCPPPRRALEVDSEIEEEDAAIEIEARSYS